MSIDFLERMETNTTSLQEIVPTTCIADIDRDFQEIECGNDLLTSTDTEIQRQVSHLCKLQDAIRFMKSRLNSSLHKSTVLLLYIRDSLNYLDDPFLHHFISNYQKQQCYM